MSRLPNTHPHGPENEAHHALQNALNAVRIADEKCEAAEYGTDIMTSLEVARRALEFAIRVQEGKV